MVCFTAHCAFSGGAGTVRVGTICSVPSLSVVQTLRSASFHATLKRFLSVGTRGVQDLPDLVTRCLGIPRWIQTLVCNKKLKFKTIGMFWKDRFVEVFRGIWVYMLTLTHVQFLPVWNVSVHLKLDRIFLFYFDNSGVRAKKPISYFRQLIV